jgi:hypothetical protein
MNICSIVENLNKMARAKLFVKWYEIFMVQQISTEGLVVKVVGNKPTHLCLSQ